MGLALSRIGQISTDEELVMRDGDGRQLRRANTAAAAAAAGDRGNMLTIAPEELLSLPASARGAGIDGPRRSTLFSALRLRRDAVSGRERHRRCQALERGSVEVLIGLLDRSGRSATHASHQLDTQSKGGGDSRCLKLLRAGCQRPVVQRLYGADRDVARCEAVVLAGGDDSDDDLDSGVSEWGSGDEGETAAFEALLKEEESKISRRRCSSPLSTPSSSSTDRLPPRWACRPKVSSFRRQQSTVVLEPPAAVRCEETHVVDSEVSPARTTWPLTAVANSPQALPPPLDERPAATYSTCQACAMAKDFYQIENVVSEFTCYTAKRSEGVQCSGPPVDKGIQTSALKLPRKSCSRERTLHVLLPDATPVETSSSSAADVSQTVREREASRAAADHLVEKTSSPKAARTPDEAIRVGRTNVRVGLEGGQDVDQGHAPIVWAVSTGPNDRRVGPVIMLPVEGKIERDNSSSYCTITAGDPHLRKFLRVTDLPNRPDPVVASGDSSGEAIGATQQPTPAVSQGVSAENDSRPPAIAVCGKSGGGGDSGRDHGLERRGDVLARKEDELQPRHMDPLWEKLGSLGERLAGVDNLFDQLEQEMDHDRAIVESCQRQAQDEVEVAANDLEEIRARRRRMSNSIGTTDVPQCRSQPDSQTYVGITPPAATAMWRMVKEETPAGGSGRDGSGEDLATTEEDAVSIAVEELREARALLNSIEHQLRGDSTNKRTATTTLTPPGSADTADGVDDDELDTRRPSCCYPSSRTHRPTASQGVSKALTPAEKCDTAGRSNSHSNADDAPAAPRFGDDGRLQCGSSKARTPRLARRRSPAVRQTTSTAATPVGRETGGSGRRDRLAVVVRGCEGVRSMGTAIAHFPTAVTVMRRRKVREPLLTTRSRGGNDKNGR